MSTGTSRQSQRGHAAQRSSGGRKKRPAFNLTCANCRRRKMRCDSGQPGCLICAAYGDSCHYDKAPPVSQIVNMAKRLQQLEELMNQLKTSDNEDVVRIVESVENGGRASLDGNSPRRASISSSATDPSFNHLRRSNSTSKGEGSVAGDNKNAPLLSTELSMEADGQLRYYGSTSAVHQPVPIPQTPSTPAATLLENGDSRNLLLLNASQSRTWEDYALNNAALALDIPRETVAKLLDTHWTWIHPTFMFVYRPAFMSDMGNGSGPYFSPFLLSVLCSHSTRFIEKRLGETLAPRTRALLGGEILNDSSIPTVQGLLQISAREIGQGAISQAWLYSGMAFRMSTDLGLHLSADTISNLGNLSAQDKEIRTRLSWSCFCWDKAMSLYLGRTPTLQDPPSDEPTLLDDYAETEPWMPYFPTGGQSPSNTQYPMTPSYAVSCFTNFCKLAVIINDIMLHLYSRQKSGSISDFVQKARGRLEAWRSASAPHLMMDTNNLPVICPPTHILTQNLLYHTTIILLHRPLHSITFCKNASRDASKSMQSLLLLCERTFGFTRITYLMAYCTYTAATIAVEDLNEGAVGALEGVKTFIRALEGAKVTCPVVQRSLDIIQKSIGQNSTEQLPIMTLPSGGPPQETYAHNIMPAFPYQQMPLDFSGRPEMFAGIDPAVSSSMLNSYPQHYLDMRDEHWLAMG